MRFYTRQHQFYCGIDLHARSLYLCALDQTGEKLVHRKLDCDREELLKALKPYMPDKWHHLRPRARAPPLTA